MTDDGKQFQRQLDQLLDEQRDRIPARELVAMLGERFLAVLWTSTENDVQRFHGLLDCIIRLWCHLSKVEPLGLEAYPSVDEARQYLKSKRRNRKNENPT